MSETKEKLRRMKELIKLEKQKRSVTLSRAEWGFVFLALSHCIELHQRFSEDAEDEDAQEVFRFMKAQLNLIMDKVVIEFAQGDETLIKILMKDFF